MAAKDSGASFQGEYGDEAPLLAWQMAWFRRHYDALVERMSTMDIVDHLAEKGRVNERMDVYQKIDSQATIPNEQARLLLSYIKRQSPACFWDFQDALAADRRKLGPWRLREKTSRSSPGLSRSKS